MAKKSLFIKGAWLHTLPRELSEAEFIKLAGIDHLMQMREHPYVSLVLDNPQDPFLVGHNNGNTIAAAMMGHHKWQTMEWK